ncbi:hypothetical protein ECANGB1_1352 [Enterospora canceri]|uniref:Uncharacterized protein n=1 Tax=Enterospora canceri TaxID=1081671 RepID=A0A1Y1S683_9MICR|nr:hypothetical protein ECANGB1_1352 [Enterospora canceri]
MTKAEIIDELKDINEIKKAIKDAELKTKGLKVEILKHYLLNYSLYLEGKGKEAEKNLVLLRLKECTVLYKKLMELEQNFTTCDVKRNVTLKTKKSRGTSPKTKYKAKFENQKRALANEMSGPKKKSKNSNKFLGCFWSVLKTHTFYSYMLQMMK